MKSRIVFKAKMRKTIQDVQRLALQEQITNIITREIKSNYYTINNIVELAPLISDALIKELGLVKEIIIDKAGD